MNFEISFQKHKILDRLEPTPPFPKTDNPTAAYCYW